MLYFSGILKVCVYIPIYRHIAKPICELPETYCYDFMIYSYLSSRKAKGGVITQFASIISDTGTSAEKKETCEKLIYVYAVWCVCTVCVRVTKKAVANLCLILLHD